jgi:hypothetical protein
MRSDIAEHGVIGDVAILAGSIGAIAAIVAPDVPPDIIA